VSVEKKKETENDAVQIRAQGRPPDRRTVFPEFRRFFLTALVEHVFDRLKTERRRGGLLPVLDTTQPYCPAQRRNQRLPFLYAAQRVTYAGGKPSSGKIS